MIALLCPWHEHHAAVSRDMERRLASGDQMALAAHSLAETYSVLTRLHEPSRVPAVACWAAIEANFIGPDIPIIALDATAYVQVLRDASDQNTIGGRTYDALIIACAVAAQANVLLTFNARHFRDLTPSPIQIVVPS